MNLDKKIEMIKKIINDDAREDPVLYPPFFNKLEFTTAGRSLLEEKFDNGEPMNCIENCDLVINATPSTLKVSVCRKGVTIAEFPKYSVSEYNSVDVIFDDWTLPLQMGEF